MLTFTIHFPDFIIARRFLETWVTAFQSVKAQFSAVNLEKCDDTVA